ncbi:MAG: hypothetical protein NZ954_04330 [Thermofilaceae archaeon]|nr:hypothetical protein [Thermofilaceae archaeon]MCX8180030.1 hypothetical protein [Thermofilaceae archaeon]MDW8003227.1 hypothetical protein [Thermofilaceae archaeon]
MEEIGGWCLIAVAAHFAMYELLREETYIFGVVTTVVWQRG